MFKKEVNNYHRVAFVPYKILFDFLRERKRSHFYKLFIVRFCRYRPLIKKIIVKFQTRHRYRYIEWSQLPGWLRNFTVGHILNKSKGIWPTLKKFQRHVIEWKVFHFISVAVSRSLAWNSAIIFKIIVDICKTEQLIESVWASACVSACLYPSVRLYVFTRGCGF